MTRKNLFTAFALLASVSSPAFAAPEVYTLDPTHTNVVWHAGHLGFSTPSGKFADVKGTVTLDEEKPEQSSLDVTISTPSVLTGIPKFDEHLKSKDFFSAEQFPSAVFKSDKVVPGEGQTAQVHGTLTLLGVSKPLILDVKLNKIGPNPFNQKKTAGFSATTIIKRSDFGMVYGLPNVADEVKITIEAEAAL